MGRRVIWEVRQRSDDGTFSKELGFFTDDAMAEQVIAACYREAMKVMLNPSFVESEWFSDQTRQNAVAGGYEIWAVNNMNSLTPTFYKVQHDLWSQVPSSMNNFVFTLEGTGLPFDGQIVNILDTP